MNIHTNMRGNQMLPASKRPLLLEPNLQLTAGECEQASEKDAGAHRHQLKRRRGKRNSPLSSRLMVQRKFESPDSSMFILIDSYYCITVPYSNILNFVCKI